MRLEAYIICWNEAAVLPFVLDYWGEAGIDKLIVYDNHSSDETTALLSDADGVNFEVEIRDYESGGHADDFLYRHIKNNCWKQSKADWVFVGDTDEVLYVPGGVKDYLRNKAGDAAIIQPCLYQVVGWQKPNFMNTRLLHEMTGMRVQQCGPNKVNLFRPDCVHEMNFGLGAHHCDPVAAGSALCSYREDIAWLHLKNLGVEYLVERNKQLYDRLPDKVKMEKRIATHYLPGCDVHNVARDLADMWAQSERFEKYPVLL